MNKSQKVTLEMIKKFITQVDLSSSKAVWEKFDIEKTETNKIVVNSIVKLEQGYRIVRHIFIGKRGGLSTYEKKSKKKITGFYNVMREYLFL